MDNRVFNVNGRGAKMLADTIRLAISEECLCGPIAGWKKDPKKGFILYWFVDSPSVTSFPVSKERIDSFAALIVDSLEEDWAKGLLKKECEAGVEDWDYECDHDGDNHLGWRAFCEDWGHVDHDAYAFLCIKPVWLWYGK
jgi:hypothetical protein